MRMDGRQSANVEDRRGAGGMVMAGGGIGTIVLALVVYLLGGNPAVVLDQAPTRSRQAPPTAEEDAQAKFVSNVLVDTEDTWKVLFRERFRRVYEEPKLVLFTDVVRSGCGTAESTMGPFYCPADHKVYIDLGFYRDLQARFGAPGDFAQAYVIAHEVGHHVQNILGISAEVEAQTGRGGGAGANGLSVRVELQADCFAGVWGHHAQKSRQILEPGDLEEALNAASAIGDDRMQKRGQGRVVPESFTHGSSAQRVRWFRAGFDSGDPAQCDTFKARSL